MLDKINGTPKILISKGEIKGDSVPPIKLNKKAGKIIEIDENSITKEENRNTGIDK